MLPLESFQRKNCFSLIFVVLSPHFQREKFPEFLVFTSIEATLNKGIFHFRDSHKTKTNSFSGKNLFSFVEFKVRMLHTLGKMI